MSGNSGYGFLSTRVGRSTLFSFMSAALLPVLVSSLMGIWYVRDALYTEAAERIDRTADNAALILLRQLSSTAATMLSLPDAAPKPVQELKLSAAEVRHLDNGGIALRPVYTPGAQNRNDGPASIQFLRRNSSGELWASTAGAAELWSPVDDLIDDNRTDVCVFAMPALVRLHCSARVTPEVEVQLRQLADNDGNLHGPAGDQATTPTATAQIADTSSLLSARRELYLQYEYTSPTWRVVSAESRATALEPASSASRSLTILIALAMVSAFVFAHAQIRRSTEPLSLLQAATRRVEEGDLNTQVSITTSDEYGDLGVAFNEMTSTLSRKLALMEVLDDVDEATLREREINSIATVALEGLGEMSSCDYATLALLDNSNELKLARWTLTSAGSVARDDEYGLSHNLRDAMFASPRHFELRDGGDGAQFDVRWIPDRAECIRAIFPLQHDRVLMGALAVRLLPGKKLGPDTLADLRRIADRVVLGIANIRLVDQLDALSSGTLLAFARAIDANSPWTAGHSERVTHLSIALGRQLGLSSAQLQTLYRGGLMHDIGKIGIPAAVLDKPGRLNDAERAMIEKHPEIGERILRPIEGFADALGIVRSHHERYNGTGYPDRLAGDEIPWLARIVAVADVFDALASDRPYRPGLTQKATITMIESDSGKHFDPAVVDALLELERSNPAALAGQHDVRETLLNMDAAADVGHSLAAGVA